MLEGHLIEGRDPDHEAVTALLRVMVLHGAPPAELAARLSVEHAQIVEEGARLKAALPAYLAQRRILLDAHCALLPPLRAIVYSYEELTTTDEFWATGIGTAAAERPGRPRAEAEAEQPPLRRSERLRQRREKGLL
jgi:hypothetical protein